uniref:Integrin alpha-2 domain-containing protein n=1 Tax=Denticeps clupeoides TaxID=299321 RepID=A0AAY4DSK6_9TELE
MFDFSKITWESSCTIFFCTRVLVGAPKEKALPKEKANNTGDAYYCPITTGRRDCTRMNLVSSDPDSPRENEILEGMWLGVSVGSQNIPEGHVLACGHRYVRIVNNGNDWRMIGRCYIRSNNMLYNPDDSGWQDYNEICSPSSDHTDEGQCDMGMSAVITPSELVAGSPGSYEWEGNVQIVAVNPQNKYIRYQASFPRRSTRNIYIGYSVAKDTGLLRKDGDTLVTGAPRDGPEANLAKGAVILTKVEPVTSNGALRYGNLTLYGEQVGSYFGCSIAIADLNNDGWKDLIVGSPFYFDRKNEKGGAVYVFMNENGSFQDKPQVVLRGPKDSAFGIAVAAIGDANQDGFQDFAVGAPFDGTGGVYIWMGGKEGIAQKPNQVIKGEDMKNGGFQTFGYSVSGGMDVDQNKYPDIVVGSLDDRIAVIRARPVIHIQKSLTVTPEMIDPDNCDSCVEVKVCFSYTYSTGGPSKRKTNVKYVVRADTTRRISRVHFLESGESTYTGLFTMPSSDCNTLKLNLVKPIRDKVEAVSFVLNMSLENPTPSSNANVQNLDDFPVMSDRQVTTDKKEIHFQKACGTDNKCHSNLKMTAEFADSDENPLPRQGDRQVLQYNASVKKLMLLVNVTNYPSQGRLAEDAHNTILNVTIPPTLQFSGSRPKNIECSVGDSFILCEIGNPVGSNKMVPVQIIFEMTDISLDTPEIFTQLQLSTLSEQSHLQPLPLHLMVEYSLQTSFTLIQNSLQISCSGEIVGESAMKSTRDIGSPVTFTFDVELFGKPLGNLGAMEVAFEWPYEVANGKWLLYLTSIEMTGTSSKFCVPPGDIVNPLNLALSEVEKVALLSENGRRRRDVAYTEAEPAQIQSGIRRPKLKDIHLSCITGGARCQSFTCPLLHMNNSAMVTIHARLWNTTMLEDYSDASRITVNGRATLQLTGNKPIVIMMPKTQEFTVKIDPDLPAKAPYKAPVWIMIVSVLAGFLLLTFIVLLLWKCGFFRRASTRKLYEAKGLKAQMRTQPSENDRLTDDI